MTYNQHAKMTLMEQNDDGTVERLDEKDSVFIREIASSVPAVVIHALSELHNKGLVDIKAIKKSSDLPSPSFIITGLYIGMLETFVSQFGMAPDKAKSMLDTALTQMEAGCTVLEGGQADKIGSVSVAKH